VTSTACQRMNHERPSFELTQLLRENMTSLTGSIDNIARLSHRIACYRSRKCLLRYSLAPSHGLLL